MNYCVKVLPRRKKTVLEKLNLEPVTDNKKIMKSVKPPTSWLKIMKNKRSINTLNSYFSNIVKNVLPCKLSSKTQNAEMVQWNGFS